MNFNDSVTGIKGVGEKRRQLLEKLNIETLGDLLYFFPRKYEDRRHAVSIIEAAFDRDVLLEVKVVTRKMSGHPYSRKSVLRVLAEDNSGSVELVFFNAKYLSSYFNPGEELTLFGRITLSNGKRQMMHPEFHKTGSKEDVRGLFPVYPLTEGLSQSQMRSMQLAIRPLAGEVKEWLSDEIVEKYNLCSPSYAIENIHFPISERPVLEGRYRLIFEELLALETGLTYIKSGINSHNNGVSFSKDITVDEFKSSLKFKLTEGQERSYREIEKDLESSKPMNRLVQGDVGSGKTIVSELAMFKAAKCGYQACFMAPTELLAKQHIKTLKKDFEPFGIRCELLSGGMKQSEKNAVLEALADGEIDILVGTHAVIQKNVCFNKLGLVITDEQHRFGVNQRQLLADKGINPNILVMTATPIPRTLAVILYGDLDISIIDTVPMGRKAIKTYLRDKSARKKVYDFVESEVKAGRQAYVVAPLIEESEAIDCISSEELYEELSKKYPNVRFKLINGAMKQQEKDAVMESFLRRETDVLVSTVVIEVGIDVANATCMVIENSERFGLAQLHQLRGRVGRGNEQSYCILISDSKSDVSKKRNEIMCETSDGFRIAEEDLKLRGPGEIFGTRQHGLPELHIADLVRNVDMIEKLREVAAEVLADDPQMEKEKNSELRRRVVKLFGDNISLKL